MLPHRRSVLIQLAWLALLLSSAQARAESEAEPRALYVVPLKAALAEQLLPLLKPVMTPGMALTGAGNQLITRATPQEYAELLRLLEDLDRPPERLLIQLGIRRGLRSGRTGQVLHGRIESSESGSLRSQIGAKLYSTRELEETELLQSIQTIAGQAARISVGQTIPSAALLWLGIPTGPAYTAQLDSVTTETGFYALARVIGQDVEVVLSQQRESLRREGELAIDRAASSVTLRGPLGAWLDVGNTASEDQHRTDAIARTYSTRELRATEEALRLRVDRLP